MSSFSFELDPQKVLGVSGEATLEEIRAAYREKAKRYHPDAGGEDWTFRILAQSYEILSTARVARGRPPTATPPQSGPGSAILTLTPGARPGSCSASCRARIKDGIGASRDFRPRNSAVLAWWPSSSCASAISRTTSTSCGLHRGAGRRSLLELQPEHRVARPGCGVAIDVARPGSRDPGGLRGLRRDEHRDPGRLVAVAGRRRSVPGMARLFQFRSGLQGRRQAPRDFENPRAGDAGVVAAIYSFRDPPRGP